MRRNRGVRFLARAVGAGRSTRRIYALGALSAGALFFASCSLANSPSEPEAIFVVPGCGDGILDASLGEKCDPIASCPTSCDDGDACTADVLTGSAAACTAECTNDPITSCGPADGCCPSSCNGTNDADCAVCGNNLTELGERCDGADCPTACDDGDACTADVLAGSAANCDARCETTALTACAAVADGCCPGGCDGFSDADCAFCGNGVTELGELCDGADCPAVCADGNGCTDNAMSGAAATCDAQCTFTPKAGCVPFQFQASQIIDGATVTCAAVATTETYTECTEFRENGLRGINNVLCNLGWSTQTPASSDYAGLCRSLVGPGGSFEGYYWCDTFQTRYTWNNHVWGTQSDNGYVQHIRCYY